MSRVLGHQIPLRSKLAPPGLDWRDYEGPLDPSPETNPRKPATDLDDWLPDSVRSATREVEELMDDLDPDGWTVEDAFG